MSDKMPDEIIWNSDVDGKPRTKGGCANDTLYRRADLNQPRTPKIDGLREAVAAYETEYWKARKAPRDQWAPFDFILEAARAQLAAQEGGVG